ncbi:hypothetical protein WJX74_008059 [Apatococcus lobatus]|uniref:Uncharacterized protein n=1 Tax=Apatococcus lobatus TaxID=904363 RepID=A0AAW1SFE0_9CHLO
MVSAAHIELALLVSLLGLCGTLSLSLLRRPLRSASESVLGEVGCLQQTLTARRSAAHISSVSESQAHSLDLRHLRCRNFMADSQKLHAEQQSLPLPAGRQEKKRIFMLEVDDEGEVVDRFIVKFSGPQSFRDFLARSGIGGLRQQNPRGVDLITNLDDLQDRFEYSLNTIKLSDLVKQQGRQLTHIQQGQEGEMGLAMQRELRLSGMARDPKLAQNLRELKYGTLPGQEFDAVIMDGDDKTYLGYHTTFAKDVSDLYLLRDAASILEGRAAAANDDEYAAFQNRQIGLCYMAEQIDPKQAERLAAECRRLKILQFIRNGEDISMVKKSLGQPASQRRPLQRLDILIWSAATIMMRRACF